ncbi:MarR family transcriptional regulator [Candidatus Haliotispira prima]|uniref:MarR family transcriptional regulator n=1 Tax=Candidatus Haliotispira prima TaxID=3034016 RepID=A0ABY8MF27_9SPIO|nr:MarR family transcriptional regulator [Candidatus Haliotispira prima]
MNKQASIGYYITKSSRLVVRMYRDALAPYNISPAQTGVLLQLEWNGNLSQKQLADHLFLDKVNVHSMVHNLLGKGLLVLEPDPKDKRRQRVSLSTEGRALIPKLVEVDKKISEALVEEFGDSRKISAYSYLSAIVESTTPEL